MMKKNFIESCWEEIEKPKKKKPGKQIQIQEHPIKKQNNEQATKFEKAILAFLIILCVLIVLIGPSLNNIW